VTASLLILQEDWSIFFSSLFSVLNFSPFELRMKIALFLFLFLLLEIRVFLFFTFSFDG